MDRDIDGQRIAPEIPGFPGVQDGMGQKKMTAGGDGQEFCNPLNDGENDNVIEEHD